MEHYKKLSIALFLACAQFSAFACSYVSAVDIFYEKGKSTLSSAENKKLQEWFKSSLEMYPVVSSLSIEANAYAPDKENAKALADQRGESIKNILSKQLPPETIIRYISFGHTETKLDVLPTTDVVFIDIRPDVEKMKIQPCAPVKIAP